MENPIEIDNQPIAATFFGEGKWLTDFVTPDALRIQELHKSITKGIDNLEDRLIACWDWVANQVKYVRFVKAKLWVNGKSSVQTDYWQNPGQVIQTRVGNCANKAFLLGSLLRNELQPSQVKVVLGNLHQPNPGGHAWCQVQLDQEYIMESTRGDMQPLVVDSSVEDVYEPVIYFNDETVHAIEGKAVLTPYAAVYTDWLRDYLDFAYINGGGR